MFLSVVLHVALFLFADWLIGDMAEPAISSPLPVISLQSLRSDNEISTRENIEDRKALKVADRQDKVAAARAAAISGSRNEHESLPKRAAAAVNRQPASGLERASARTAEMSASQDAAVARPEVATTDLRKAPLVMTGAARNEPPAFAMAEISPRQETMLKRKFREWTEDFHNMSDVADGLTWKYKGQEYLAEFTNLVASDDMGIERVAVVVSTEENGQRLSTEMHMKRLSFSNYAQFINRWDSDVQIHDDELDGRFHSNTEINLAYSRKIRPQFHGQVTTSARRVNFSQKRGHLRRDQIFLGGLETGVKAIRLPKHFFPFPEDMDLADEQVQHFDDDARITFYDDGSYEWQTIGTESSKQKVSISGNSCFLIAGKDVNLHVKGTVNGKVLVYSPERIIIEGNLVYADDPMETPEADDFLGLASDKYVEVAPPDVTGPGDLVINAAIYAKRRFAVSRYRFREESLLHIYGSLTAGSLSATEPRYATRIEFDQRLEQLRPPRFPMTDRYAIESWDNNWRVEPATVLR
jgi:hypothetical protein